MVQLLICQDGLTEMLKQQDYQAQLTLTQALLTQDQFQREKMRVQHFLQGDQSTSYYHHMAIMKVVTKQIHTVHGNIVILSSSEEIEQYFLQYFKSIFCLENNCFENSILQQSIPNIVTQQDNLFLAANQIDIFI